MDKIWAEIKQAMQTQVPSHSYKMWLDPIQFHISKNGCCVLACPNCFSRKRVQEQYGGMISSEFKKRTGRDIQVSYVLADENRKLKPERKIDPQLALPNFTVRPHSGRMLRKDFTFDHFVVGNSNDFAYSASLSLASRKNGHQNSLFLLSQTGMGKSHLAQAVGNHILHERPQERVYYVTLEDFSNEMVQAFRQDKIDHFHTKYRNNCDVLLLEDVHSLTGKERTQLELAMTLDNLYEAQKKVIFSSCYPPGEIPKLNDKLRSRLCSGLISTIEPPNFRTRVKILKKKASFNGYVLPEDVIHYLASELTEDVRQLESGLIGVTAKSSLLGANIDMRLAESVVKNIVRQRKSISIDMIKRLVCKHFGISTEAIMSRSRRQEIVRPRQIAMFLSRRYTDSPLQTIGKSFNRYHATAMHAITTVENELRKNAELQKQVEFFRHKLESGKL